MNFNDSPMNPGNFLFQHPSFQISHTINEIKVSILKRLHNNYNTGKKNNKKNPVNFTTEKHIPK